MNFIYTQGALIGGCFADDLRDTMRAKNCSLILITNK